MPREEERNGVIIGYNIEYRLTPSPSAAEEPTFDLISHTPTTQFPSMIIPFTLSNLEGGASYDVRVSARTAVGPGPPTPILTETANAGM